MQRSQLACKWLALVCSAVLLLGCEGSVSGGEQTSFDTAIDLTGATLRVNNVSGSDAADGIVEPYQSLQYAFDQLRPGDVLVIEETSTPYSSNAIIGEERNADGSLLRTLRGFVISTSGTASAPIVIEGRGVDRPEIDQMQTASVPTDATIGLLLDCVSHVTIRNLEIHSANEAGISSSTLGACETSGLVLEDNHIHDIYGEKYVGGIRMMGVSDAVLRGNHIHDVFSNEAAEDKSFIKNGTGISNLLVENNHLEMLDTGVAVNAQGLGNTTFLLDSEEPVAAIQIRDNVFDTVGEAVSLLASIADSATTDEQETGLFHGVDIVGNTFTEVNTAVHLDAGASQNQSSDICMYNNTIVDTAEAVFDVSGVTDLEVFNNIVVTPQSQVIQSHAPQNASLLNSLNYADYNLFYNFVSLTWQLDVGGSNETTYADLASWQSAAHPELLAGADASSFVNDPLFLNATNGDYTLDVASPAINAGRFGRNNRC